MRLDRHLQLRALLLLLAVGAGARQHHIGCSSYSWEHMALTGCVRGVTVWHVAAGTSVAAGFRTAGLRAAG